MNFLNKAITLSLAGLLLIMMGCASSGSVKDTGTAHMTLRNYLEQTPGVVVTGQGRSTSVRIRGMRDMTGPRITRGTRKGTATSVQTQNTPLFVVDGEIVGRSFYRAASMLTASIIEDVRVLSPTEAAHFGSRGAHGAVLITTTRVKNN